VARGVIAASVAGRGPCFVINEDDPRANGPNGSDSSDEVGRGGRGGNDDGGNGGDGDGNRALLPVASAKITHLVHVPHRTAAARAAAAAAKKIDPRRGDLTSVPGSRGSDPSGGGGGCPACYFTQGATFQGYHAHGGVPTSSRCLRCGQTISSGGGAGDNFRLAAQHVEIEPLNTAPLLAASLSSSSIGGSSGGSSCGALVPAHAASLVAPLGKHFAVCICCQELKAIAGFPEFCYKTFRVRSALLAMHDWFSFVSYLDGFVFMCVSKRASQNLLLR
jgi:hypothetical protein